MPISDHMIFITPRNIFIYFVYLIFFTFKARQPGGTFWLAKGVEQSLHLESWSDIRITTEFYEWMDDHLEFLLPPEIFANYNRPFGWLQIRQQRIENG